MKKFVSALVSAAFLATPMVVISTPAAAQTVMPSATASSFKVEAKKSGKKSGKKAGKSKAKKAM